MKLLLIGLLLFCTTRAEFDDWHEDYYHDEPQYEQVSPERNDNMYVKGFYGHGYSSQRYSHFDYIMQSYDGSDKELGTHVEDYCDTLEMEY